MSEYSCWPGVVAFDFNPAYDQKTIPSGSSYRKFAVNVEGYEDTVDVQLWDPDFTNVNLSKGDLILAGGKVTTWEKKPDEQGNRKTMYQMSVSSLAIIPSQKSKPAGVQGKPAASGVKRKAAF